MDVLCATSFTGKTAFTIPNIKNMSKQNHFSSITDYQADPILRYICKVCRL